MQQSMNRFSFNPANLDIPRSAFDRPYNRYQTFSSARIVPFYLDEVLPGDSCTLQTNAFIRMSKPILPAMDPLYCDMFFFFVPMRLIWNNYKQFFGENDSTAWTRQTNLELPHLTSGSIAAMQNKGDYASGSLLDYLGVHLGDKDTGTATDRSDGKCALDSLEGINTLPIRAYYAICNEWFRDENYDTPLAYSKGDSGVNDYLINGSLLNGDCFSGGAQEYVHRGGLVKPHALHDYFTSVLPAPQKSAAIIPVGSYENPFGPSGGNEFFVPVIPAVEHLTDGQSEVLKMRARFSDGSVGSGATGNVAVSGGNVGYESATPTLANGLVPSNLWASLPASVFASVNQIRYAFALQRFYEKDARGGTRYREKIKAHFGVTGSDSSMMVPEYLGGERFMLNMDTILTTADTSDGTTGEYAGYSKTFQRLKQFSKSFTEHGYLMGVMCVRPKKIYHQGIPKLFLRKDQLDFYWPSFANLGEQDARIREIYAGSARDDEVFGYHEAYAEYRYKPSELSGSLRPESATFIQGYTYATTFSQPAAANAVEARSTYETDIGQNLAVPSGPQFVSMIHVEGKWRRPMPVYSIPGLVDHH